MRAAGGPGYLRLTWIFSLGAYQRVAHGRHLRRLFKRTGYTCQQQLWTYQAAIVPTIILLITRQVQSVARNPACHKESLKSFLLKMVVGSERRGDTSPAYQDE